MINFAGILEYLSSWKWHAEGALRSSSGCLVPTEALPLLLNDEAMPQPLGEYAPGGAVFDTEVDAYTYFLDIMCRVLQYCGYRDNRVANFKHETSCYMLRARDQ